MRDIKEIEAINVVELGLDSEYAKDMGLVGYTDEKGANYISCEDAIAYVQDNSFVRNLKVVSHE